MARKAQAVFTDLNLFKNQLQNAVIHTGTTLPRKDNKADGIEGQIFNLKSNDTANDNQAGLYIFKGSDWQLLPTTETIQQSIKDSVKGLKPKGSVDFTNWVEIPLTDDAADNASNSALQIGETNQYRKSYVITFRKLTSGSPEEELERVGAYLDGRFNYDKGVTGVSQIECPWNIDLGADALVVDENGAKKIKDTFTFVDKTILLKDTLKNNDKKEYGAYKIWQVDKSDPANWKLHIHRVANFSGEAVDDGTTDGRPATDTEKDATNVYLFVQKGQQFVHKDVSFVQTNDAVVGEKELSFQQFSGAQDGLSATGSLRISGGNTVEAITSKTRGETSEVLVTYDTLEKIEATAKLVAEKTEIRTIKINPLDSEGSANLVLPDLEDTIESSIVADINTKDRDDSRKPFAANNEEIPKAPDRSNYEIVSVEIFHNDEKVLVGVDIKEGAKVGIAYNTDNNVLQTLQVTAEIRYRLSGDIYALLAKDRKSSDWQK